MTYKIKKIIKIVICLLLTSVFVLSVCMNSFTTEAADRFPGVQILVNKTTASDPFTILEVVDDTKEASIGFYIRGNEPFGVDANGRAISFDDMISSITDADLRAKFVSDTLVRLDDAYYVTGANGTASDYPLVYTPYEEAYFVEEASIKQWEQVVLKELQTVTLEGEYVEIVPDSDGTTIPGNYVKNENTYAVAENNEGTHVENIAAFYTSESPTNYNVVFEAVPETFTNEDAIGQSIAKYGAYLPMTVGSTTTYYYDGPSVNTETGLTYYYVKSFVFAENTGVYGIRYRDGEEKYIPCPEGQVATHYKVEDSYSFLKGAGNYEFVPSNNGKECSVEVDRYFYKGGFYNNNWFKGKVFLFNQVDLDANVFPTVVKTVTTSQLTEDSFEDVDLAVINATSWEENADIADILSILSNKINVGKFPCVINSRLMAASESSSVFYTNMQRYFNSADTDGNFVYGSVYWHTGPILNAGFADTLTNDEGFQDISTYIAAENNYRELEEDADPIVRELSQAVAIEYVLGRQSARNIAVKEKLTVLEIEPCADYYLTDKSKVRAIIGYSETQVPDNKIEIVQMTTAEFIGKIEDLNGKYDFIYIGMQTGKMNVDEETGKTVYNDPYMEGYVYTNIGDYVLGSERISGMMNTDYVRYFDDNGNLQYGYYPYDEEVYGNRTRYLTDENGNYVLDDNGNKILVMDTETMTDFEVYTTENTSIEDRIVSYGSVGVYRYSGNDITKDKLNQLKEYIQAGYPIVLDKGFFKNSGGQRVINDEKVDNSSYLYELLSDIWTRPNLFFYDDIVSSKTDKTKHNEFQFYMTIPKLKIEMSVEPADAVDGKYIEADDKGRYYLTYAFSVTDEAAALPASTLYTAKLYVDMNSDGKYSRQTEYLDDALILEQETGNRVNANELIAGKTYVLKRQIPDGFRSVVPWKLEVNQTENALIRQSKIGYAGINLGGAKEQIEVLQILSDRNGTNEYTNPNNFNLKNNATFKRLASGIKDFQINVTTIYTSTFESTYNKANTLTYSQYLNKFDMLVLGFDDAYQDFEKPESVNALKDYIESGKSVLFTHDTTSFNNFKGSHSNQQSGNLQIMDTSNYRWGYEFNTKIRDLVGMDRYGITVGTNSAILKEGQILTKSPDPDNPGDFEIIESSGKDMAYVIGSNRTQTYPETQGWVYLSLNIAKDEITNKSTYYNLSDTKTDIEYTGSQNNGSMSGMKVTEVNEGQITKYPYELKDSFGVASTHSQYYQLDLNADKDNDGESDIVVWYCISDSSSRTVDMYAASPNDVRNNYYIYSIGNVFYSGVGHSNVTDEDEMKLFVNTLVAAYTAEITPPTVGTLSEEDVESQSASTVRLPIELTVDENNNTTEEYLDRGLVQFYYSVNDTNFVNASIGGSSQKNMFVKYYLKSNATNAVVIEGIENGSLKGIDITDKIATQTSLVDLVPIAQEDGTVKYAVNSGYAYTASIPIADVSDYIGTNDSMTIYIVVSSSFNHYGNQTYKLGYDEIYVKKTNLFNLD